MITLFGINSPNVFKILIMLEELELPYELVTVDVLAGAQFAKNFRALNPNGKVPVLVDRRTDQPVMVWESGAILIYLAERARRFLPLAGHARYATLQWLMLQMASIGPMLGQQSHFRIYAPGPENDYSRKRYDTEVARLHALLEEALFRRDHIADDAFTIADMAIWPWLNAPMRRGIEIERFPRLADWISRIGERPAVERAGGAFQSFNGSKLETVLQNDPEAIDRLLGRGRFAQALRFRKP